MLRTLLLTLLALMAPLSANAQIADGDARSCGVAQDVLTASHAAAPVLARFDREAAFADRGGGPVRIIEFADYSCPVCRALHPHWVALARADRRVRISVVEYPIYGRTLISRVTGNETLDASRIAIAAAAQHKQLAFHDALMSIPGQVDDRAIAMAAARAGLNLQAARTLANSPEIIARADANLRLAAQLELVGTPHVIVDGVMISLQRGWTLDQVDCLIAASSAGR